MKKVILIITSIILTNILNAATNQPDYYETGDLPKATVIQLNNECLQQFPLPQQKNYTRRIRDKHKGYVKWKTVLDGDAYNRAVVAQKNSFNNCLTIKFNEAKMELMNNQHGYIRKNVKSPKTLYNREK